MTAIMVPQKRQYSADFKGCGSERSFRLRVTHALGLKLSLITAATDRKAFWHALCDWVTKGIVAKQNVHVRLTGIEELYDVCPESADTLFSILREAKKSSHTFSADAVIGRRNWKI